MRISDWSSDVCSSDLQGVEQFRRVVGHALDARVIGAAPALDHVGRQCPRTAGEPDQWQPRAERAAERRDRIHHIAQFGLRIRSEEHTSELQSLMRTSYAVVCFTKKI